MKLAKWKQVVTVSILICVGVIAWAGSWTFERYQFAHGCQIYNGPGRKIVLVEANTTVLRYSLISGLMAYLQMELFSDTDQLNSASQSTAFVFDQHDGLTTVYSTPIQDATYGWLVLSEGELFLVVYKDGRVFKSWKLEKGTAVADSSLVGEKPERLGTNVTEKAWTSFRLPEVTTKSNPVMVADKDGGIVKVRVTSNPHSATKFRQDLDIEMTSNKTLTRLSIDGDGNWKVYKREDSVGDQVVKEGRLIEP